MILRPEFEYETYETLNYGFNVFLYSFIWNGISDRRKMTLTTQPHQLVQILIYYELSLICQGNYVQCASPI